MILEDYGWDSWFDDQYKSLNMQLTIGRVVGNSEIYKVACEDGIINARISDRLFYATATDSELPVPGDWVLIIADDSDSGYSIYDLLPRRSFLAFPDSENPEEQIPAAANVDYIVAAVPSDYGLDPAVVENLVNISREWGAEPLIICYGNHSANCASDELKNSAGDTSIIFIDSLDKSGLSRLNEALAPRKTYAVTGVNEDDVSVIISYLTDGEVSDYGSSFDSETEKGVLHLLPSSAILFNAPLPGDAGLFNGDNDTDESEDFGDIIEVAALCRFNDCRHVNEPGCAILEALDNGELDYDNYKAFLKALKKESGRISITEQSEARKLKKSAVVKTDRMVSE